MSTLTQVLRGEADTWAIEKRCLRKDGSVVKVGVHGAVLRDDAGRVVRIVAMISDLTASKQADPELRDAESTAEKGKPVRREKAAVKKARGSARAKSSDKQQIKKR